MRLNAIDYKYLGIAIGYSVLLYGFHLYYNKFVKHKKGSKTDSSGNDFSGNVFYDKNGNSKAFEGPIDCTDSLYCCPDGVTPAKDASMSNCDCSGLPLGCCPDGTTHKLDASGTNCDPSGNPIPNPFGNSINNQMIYVTINIFAYFSILMMWFFAQQSKQVGHKTLIPTILYAGIGCALSVLLLYISFVGIERLMETKENISYDPNDQNTQGTNYCTDPCTWYNKDQCANNLTWNGIACVWDTAQSSCKTPKTTYWTRNIIRTVTVILTLIILFVGLLHSDSIKEWIRKDKNLVWMLNIPVFLEKCKQDIRITTPTIWLLLGIEIIILLFYSFGNHLAYQAYHKDGTVIYHPPIPTSFRTSVGCQVLNQINNQIQTPLTNTDKSNNLMVIRKGWISTVFPFLMNDTNPQPIPSNTYILSTDFIIKNAYNDPEDNDSQSDSTDTRTLNANFMINNEASNVHKMNTTNYNYGISLWMYIDPHQTGNTNNHWYTLFNFDKKPILQYNPNKNSMRIQTIQSGTNQTNTTKSSRQIPEIPLQKWNHIFINNVGGTVDMFLNAEIVANIKQVIPKSKTDNIIIGQDGGIVGRICNVMYFKKTLSKLQINDIYRKYQNYDPPIL